jgi:hypothetical protein
VFQKCHEMMDLLAKYEGSVYEAWTRDVGNKSEVNLNLPLLQRDPETKLVRVNFDPQLVAVLREVKYLEMTKSSSEIPESAAAIFSRNESFRQQIGNLSIAATEYNRVRQTILPVESPLIAAEMTSIDATLERAISQLNWNSPESAEYCLATKNLVEDLSGRVQRAKANIDAILAILAKWYDAPLLVRDVKTGLLNYDEKDKLMANAFEAIRAGGEKFHKLIEENSALFKADADSPTWHAYVDYVDSMVVDGLYNTIHVSLSYLLDNTDAKPVDESQVRPLLEGKMALVPPDIRFDPALVEGNTITVQQQIAQITADFFSVGSRVARLAKHRGSEDYRADLEGMAELVDLKEELLGKVNAAIDKILGFEQTLLDDYQHLWLDDRAEFMRQFLLYNHVLTQEDIEQYGDEPIPESPPTLEQFKQNIDKYNAIADTVSKVKDNILFDQWFRVDVRGFKTSLHATVKKWSFMFLKHLTEHVTNTLNELSSFIQEASVGLKTEITEGSYDKLVYVMGYLNAVTSRAESTDRCFGPLNDTVQLLRTFDVDMPDAVHQLLSNLPAKWGDMKKLAENVGHSVAPVQADEVSKLKRRSNQFDVRNFEFREDFLKRAPLRYDSQQPYERIDKHFSEYLEMEREMNSLQKAADLFMVKLPEYKQLKACRKELALLKQVWDMIFLVRSQFEEWEQTNWQQVNVESMEMECKKLVAEIRALDKESRAWEAFNGIDSKVKNMITSLSAVGLLQSPAIRDRHWQQVMNTTGVKIEMSAKTTLADLLALNLHEFEDDVAGIVDRANKEQGMEKMLTQLETTWSSMNFDYDMHRETQTPMLKASEELIETLEENQVQLQNLLTSKYIAYFLEAVSGWQKKLSTADSVIEIWFEVQRTWSHLQSIFIGSEDIRNQLPEDSKRFDTIDHDFKEIMRSAKETPNVVQATNKQGLFDLLEDLQARLSLCEKALQEYLETKRLAFPRFYFISPSDLLDILSNGNQPAKVAKQLDKLFQMLCDLKMSETDDKEAIGMYALDGEYVPFTKPCRCEGRVEVWLMNVLVTMIQTIREIMTESVVAYEEKPRSEWVFDYPAQVSLVGTQIWWATEVNIAFGRLEEGYENAMKEYNKKQISHLNDLITLLQGKLSGAHRVMLQTICTVDVHSRDVVQNLIATKAENAEAFAWISQLRHMWDEKAKHCRIAICDARFTYCYEYLGNVPRLVITPLTDRCYITLTQSLHLIMSGAPAGPAGTGKTETTKDLARNLGIMTYVFNCSEQMDYKSVGNIYKGLAQSGAWGCFDEFNRISVEVLSVVAVQVKTIQDAVRAKKKRFNFLGEEISLDPTVGIFITMNPGYAGRTELPENIKALFRPCAMVVPDYGQICEIMLVSEGFLNAKLLARKFITLYTLNRDLLSKQDHYDWGLRAIKSVLVVAGSLKRADPDRNEDEVLMRALRDFNIPKIVTEDLPVFMGLIFDLFPGLNVPRKRDMEFEKTVRQAVLELKLQAEDSFVLKVVQLQELLDVRHSVFVLGAAGGGKSCILKSLNKSYQLQKRKPVWADLNPKAVTTNELYGYSNVTTREWVDGLFSSIMRDISKLSNDSPKWMVLDGDIDTLWVESLNCFPADDHEVLTENGFMSLAAVQHHFSHHTTLSVACYVDGELQYHPIGQDKLTVKEGQHKLIEFCGASDTHATANGRGHTAANHVSLVTTANHRMFGVVGPTRHECNEKSDPPAYRILRADEVVAAGEKDPSTVMQLRCNAEEGLKGAPLLSLPPVDALGLATEDAVLSFIELYGYWMGDGCLATSARAVAFAPVKQQDTTYLEGLFERVGLRRLLGGAGLTAEGYVKNDRNANGQILYTVTARRWWDFFARQYGHKYKGYWAEVAALEGALMREGSVPKGLHREAVAAEEVEARLRSLYLRGPDDLVEGQCELPDRVDKIDDADEVLALLRGKAAGEPSPPEAEDVESGKWIWFWLRRSGGRVAVEAFVRGLKFADGTQTPSVQNRTGVLPDEGGNTISTSSARFREELTQLLLHGGFATHSVLEVEAGAVCGTNEQGAQIIARHPHWKVHYSNESRAAQPRLLVREEVKARAEQWQGTVWCVTVPTSQQLIVVRRVSERDNDGVVLSASRPTVVGNTTMDDNKVLTLASNERITLKPSMRLLFEIANLTYASPATVSRAGILFVNPSDLGWSPFVTSWIESLESPGQKANLMILFEKYVPTCLDALRNRFKMITPVSEWSMVNSLCHLLKLLLVPANTPEGCSKEDYELYFAWAAVWAFGGALFKDQLVDWRDEFSKWWVTEFKTVKFPSQGTVFDYFIRTEDKKFAPWGEIVPKFEFDPELPLQAALVPTAETVRVRFWMDMLIKAAVPVLLVGAPGTGKTAIILNKLKSLDEDWVVAQASFNHYTIHHTMQAVLEAPLEKKAGRNYGPPGTKRLIYFVDDLNMPAVDAYGTASPHTVMRQHIDYNHWYDRQKHTMKVVSNTQYVCAMNPKAGSFTINPRLLRHFTVFALSSPSNEALQTIYRSLLGGHLTHSKFPTPVMKICDQLVDAAIKLHTRVATTFLPTAIRFHYIFNLRDLSNIFQGINFSSPEAIKAPMQLVRLWLHETDRVYSDKLIDEKDLETFQSLQTTIARETFPDLEADKLLEFPRIHCHFAAGMGDSKYQPIKDWPALSAILEESLNNYNEVNAAMGLVLFRDAMQHICRINRILESPRGNALLVGVGGSGKQSLSRLAAFISNLETFQIQLSKGYGINELKVDLAKCFVKTGQKGVGVMFLMTDAQVADEKFLVLINDLLSSGQIPDLFPDDQRQEVIDGVRNEVKSMGMEDNNANCWEFFLERVRRLLKVVLCFSPVGDALRLRSRKFPGLVNCTTINWFHEWPLDALVSVSKTFLEDTEFIPGDLKAPISEFMAYVHTSVNELSKVYLQNERRYNYTTPKSFLEQIKLYKGLLEKKAQQLQNNMDRMENGLTKLKSTAAQVDDLKEKLKAQEVELAQKNQEADALIERVGVETEKVNKEKEIAAVEEEKVRVITEDVSAKQKSCEADLAKAEPALVAAQEALNTLNKTNLTELKSFGTPPPIVVTVTAAVMVLLAKGKVPKDRSWKAGKLMMGNVGEFLDSLITYDKENIPQENLVEVKKYLADPEFTPDFVRGKSLAAAGLCSWVCNIVTFYEVYCDVEPKRNALKEANAQLEAAQSKLAKIMEKIKKLDEALAKLTAEFQAATDAKLKCQREADATTLTISLANRLVGGLASEKVRWGDAVTRFKEQEKTLPGDVLLVSAFLSYTGCFSKRYREVLMNEKWLPFIHTQSKPIPITEGLDPLSLLTDSASIAKWQNEGLPADRVSTENATILTNAQRWPLIIDPQEQGIKWIKQREADLRVVRLGQKGYLDFIERAVSNGDCVLIENLGENIDPVLDNLLGRVTIKKGRAIIIGDKEVEYSPKFRLILHTKLGNPHYKPELQAQCTLINFTVTQLGLEDQLLADVVSAERPDLQVLKAKLTKEQNEYMITLKELEDALLARLSSAEGDFLRDVALVESLENTKSTAAEIEEKVKLAKNTEVEINTARENYRPAAARASLLYFIINELYKIHPMYQVSLKAFNVVFQRAIKVAEPDEDVGKRVLNIIDTITYNVFVYTTRGLFERDKLIFTAQMAFQILAMKKEIVPAELDFLLRGPSLPNNVSPVDFLSNALWGSVKALSVMPGDAFQGLDRDIEGSAKRWKKFCESEVPEKEKFPGEWKNKTSMQRLCMLRCLRPDRMLYAIRLFVAEQLGERYTAGRQVEFAKSFEETSRSTGVFFILSPGVNPVLQVEELGRKLGYTADAGNYHQVSLGQGQEVVAEQALNVSSKEGHWVILENIHLVSKWLPALEKKMEECAADAHENFRFFLTAEPASSHASHIMPAGILQACIKITNEPPTGMQANIHAAMDEFSQETLEMCAREVEFKKIWFSLCYFHAVVIERRKFGPMGWNRNYPFNRGDLTISVNVLYNYLEANAVVPWTDLRYLFGEIMYGGHITDNLDRRLCSTYLQEYMKPEMLDGDLELAVGFNAPPPLDYAEYHAAIDETLPAESPYLYGMHPNAEIEFLTVTSAHLCNTVLELQPRDTGGKEGEAGQTREERLRTIIDEILEKLPDEFNMNEMGARCPPEERTPYTVVAFQECARMNRLTREIRRSLKELELGLKGELTITAAMESLSDAMFMNKVAPYWEKLAYPSTKPLAFWYADLLDRIKFLEAWSTDFNLPNAVWLGGLFNPQSFLTAIEQQTARKNEWPLDKMCLQCEVTKKYSRDDFPSPPREGSYVYGLYMEGARWDVQTGLIQECRLKELCPAMPVLFIKAIPLDKLDVRGTYDCPVFKTKERGRANEQVAVGVCPGFVWSLNLKTKVHPNKWILAGVAMLLSD